MGKNDFFKAIAKCGVVVDTHVKFLLVRTLKKFISIIQTNKMAMYITKSSSRNSFLRERNKILTNNTAKWAIHNMEADKKKTH